MKSEKSTVKRVAKRAVYNTEEINAILDKDFLCHVGFIHENYPVVIPTIYGRKKDKLYLHGATVSRMMKNLSKGEEISISVANVNGLVIARSAFHHSANYESVVLFGKGKLIEDTKEKIEALQVISDQVIRNRWEESRLPTDKELAITAVVEVEISTASAKVRTGFPVDDQRDYELDIWAGIVPIDKKYGTPIPDEQLNKDLPVPTSVLQLIQNNQ